MQHKDEPAKLLDANLVVIRVVIVIAIAILIQALLLYLFS